MTEGNTGVPCVGALAYDADDRLLLIRRGNDPGRGLWSVPGGRVEPGESDAEAVVREMAEETGLVVEPGTLVGTVRRGPYLIADYRCAVVGGTLRAGDDAIELAWYPLDALPDDLAFASHRQALTELIERLATR